MPRMSPLDENLKPVKPAEVETPRRVSFCATALNPHRKNGKQPAEPVRCPGFSRSERPFWWRVSSQAETATANCAFEPRTSSCCIGNINLSAQCTGFMGRASGGSFQRQGHKE